MTPGNQTQTHPVSSRGIFGPIFESIVQEMRPLERTQAISFISPSDLVL